ncbi:MAG: transposase [Saprospirales bacterium]|nr:transposase [Saprospirales bacterium]
MYFEPNVIYHIYNQGNNRQRIFFNDENYLFFIKKMREFLLPHAEILCYCLMPNHFHWLVFVREVRVAHSVGVTSSHADTPMRPLNDSIGILLRSYTRAINKQENRIGALFREKTKAKDGWESPFVAPGHPDYCKIWKQWDIYGITCLNYIHNNPVRAGLVHHADDWLYSSSQDFSGKRKGSLCNQALARELLALP